MYSAINMLLYLQGKPLHSLPKTTMIGALMHYLVSADANNFQPMNANYGIVECDNNMPDKVQKKQNILDISKKQIEQFKEEINGQ